MNISIRSLTRVFGATTAVDHVSFSFGSGDVIGFVGPNGAGKTTTMRILATLDEPTSGDILLDGVSLVDYPEQARRRIGFMPDSLPEHGDITAHEYIDFFGRAFGLRGPALERAVAEVEDFTGVAPIRDKVLRALSKGMKQRVSLARALVHNPDLLIMDEPANGLDPRARIELRELVKILAEQGKPILVSSHILSELEEMVTGVVILERGRLVRDATRGLEEAFSPVPPPLPQADGAPAAPAPAAPQASIRVFVRLLGDADPVARLLETPGVLGAVRRDRGAVATVAGGDDEAAALLASLVTAGLRPVEFTRVKVGLEDLFLDATKGDLA